MKKTSSSGRKPKRRVIDPDNPEWTDLRRFRPAREVFPNVVEACLRRRGRPPEGTGTKVQVTLRLDPAVIAHFKATGEGWQTRINDTLAKAISSKGARRR